MNRIVIEGRDERTIVVSGDLTRELDIVDERAVLAFGDGTVVRAGPDPENRVAWWFTPVFEGSAAHELARANPAVYEGTDRVTLDGDIRWMLHGTDFAAMPPPCTCEYPYPAGIWMGHHPFCEAEW